MILTSRKARQLLSYDENSGVLVWKPRPGFRQFNTRFAGHIAGCTDPAKYVRVRIEGRLYLAHRVAWLIVHGKWPANDIDHRFGIAVGNAFANLRSATRTENMQNKVMASNNTSGFIGVSWAKGSFKWTARIKVPNGKYLHLGLFETKETAAAAYAAAKRRHHPFQPIVRVA